MVLPSIRAAKLNEKRLKLRQQYWPDVPEEMLWHRKKSDGFITIPRVLPLVMAILDDTAKNKPLSKTYFGLWCRTFDENMVTIQSPQVMAFEAGFRSQRAAQTWKARMQTLVDLGFIMAKPGGAGDFSAVLILNPIFVIRKLRESKRAKIQDAKFNALVARASEVGAKDFDFPLPKKK